MNDMTVVIPARKLESAEGLKNKDILPFGDSNLLIHKIRQLKKVPDIDIVVSTESGYLAEMAHRENVKCLMRPKYFSYENTPFNEFVKYVCNEIDSEHIMWACVTSPLVDAELYIKALKLYKEKIKKGYDSLVTVQKLQRYLMDKNGALNFRTGKKFKSRKLLPELYVFTNGISIAARKKMIEWEYTSGEIPYMMEIGKREAIDICDEFDYECAMKFLGEKK